MCSGLAQGKSDNSALFYFNYAVSYSAITNSFVFLIFSGFTENRYCVVHEKMYTALNHFMCVVDRKN